MKILKKTLLVVLTLFMCLVNLNVVVAEDEETSADEPEALYSAYYVFFSADEEELPEEVMALLPETKTDLPDGTLIENEAMPDVMVGEDMYSFLGWDNGLKYTIDKADVTFTGGWKKNVLTPVVETPEETPAEAVAEAVTDTLEEAEEEIETQEITETAVEGETYHVEFRFLYWCTFSNDNLPEEVMALQPEGVDVPVGEEPDLPEYELTAGFQFKGWDKAQWTDDSGALYTIYYGLWDRLMFRVVPSTGNPGYPGAVQVVTGSVLGVPGSAVPSFSIGGQTAYCVTPWITGYPVTGTSYWPQSLGYGDASPMSERVANVMITAAAMGASQATTQAAVWDALGYNYGVSWQTYYNSGIEAWGVVYESYLDPSTGMAMQDLGVPTGSRPKGGYVKVYKRASAVNGVNYASSFPNNYSLAGAVYGVYSNSACTSQVATLTTNSSGETGTTSVLDAGTYYVKEISASPGFKLDTNVYPVTVTAGNTSSITSNESPVTDPMMVHLYKYDRRDSKWVENLDGAQFTLKYYDAQTNDPTSLTPKLTFVFKSQYNAEGKVECDFGNPDLWISGDSVTPYLINGVITYPLGTFTIEETQAPTLFAADPNIYVGHITQNGETANEAVDHYIDEDGNVKTLTDGSAWILDIDNLDLSQNEELQTVSLTIQKVDSETGKAELPSDHVTSTATLEGAVFHIYRIGEYNTDKDSPQIVSIDPVDYGTVTTDSDGKAELLYEPGTTDGLLPGRFRIVEETAPDGFAINETVFTLDAPVKSANTATFEYSISIGDKLTRIQVEKLDDKGDLIPLNATATIQLIEKATGNVVYEYVADGQPHIIKGLTTLTNYYLHEVYVAPNYRLAIDKDVNPIDANDSELHGSSDEDHPYTNYYHMVDHEIEIHTTATFDGEGKKDWDNQSSKHYVADGVAHIFDEVSYKNVYEGETYKLVGELWDKTDNVSLDNVVEKEFVPTYDVGIETLEFEQQLDDLDNHELVVFETLYRIVTNDDGSTEEIKVVEHKDLDDEDQTIYVDELYRRDFKIVKVNADDTTEPLEGVVFHISTYRVKRDGVVEDIDLGEFTTDADGLISIEGLKEDCKITVTEIEELDPTWYRWEEDFVYDIGHDSSVTETLSVTIENHQIKIGTSAKFEESDSKNYVADGVAHIIDTVSYEWLYEGEQYKLVATLIDKGTEDEPAEEELMTVEHEFTASGLNGTEDVEFEIDLDGMDNHDFVVYEELYHIITEEVPQTDEEGNPVLDEDGNPITEIVPTGEEPLVAEHKDIDDDDQTVHVDELYRAVMVMYKTNASKSIRLNGAVFTVTTKRTKRDGTVVTEDLGKFVTGGIYVEDTEAFTYKIATDEEMTDIVKTVSSTKHSKFGTQYIQVTDLADGIYYGQMEGEDYITKHYVAKGMIYLVDQIEDTEITYHEEIAPEGYYLPGDDFVANVGHDYALTKIENERPNQAIVSNRPVIPNTGFDGE